MYRQPALVHSYQVIVMWTKKMELVEQEKCVQERTKETS